MSEIKLPKLDTKKMEKELVRYIGFHKFVYGEITRGEYQRYLEYEPDPDMSE